MLYLSGYFFSQLRKIWDIYHSQGFCLISVSASQSSHNVKEKKNPKTYGQIRMPHQKSSISTFRYNPGNMDLGGKPYLEILPVVYT